LIKRLGLCEIEPSVIKDNSTKDETNFEHILHENLNIENEEEDKILYSYENINDVPIEVQGTYTTSLKSGAQILVIKRNKKDILVKNVLEISVSTETQYDIIDSNKIKESNKKTESGIMIQWLENANKKIENLECTLNIEKLAKDKVIKNSVIIQQKLSRNIKEGEVQGIMYKYGVVGYTIYLIFSLAVLFSFGSMYFIWRIKEIYLMNPVTLFMGMLMGLGWSATAIAGIYSCTNKRSKLS